MGVLSRGGVNCTLGIIVFHKSNATLHQKLENGGREHGVKIQERAMNVAFLPRPTGNQKICFLVQGSRSDCTPKESVFRE